MPKVYTSLGTGGAGDREVWRASPQEQPEERQERAKWGTVWPHLIPNPQPRLVLQPRGSVHTSAPESYPPGESMPINQGQGSHFTGLQ